ncbi:MAG TPA: HAD hydrolase-like protein, partial [Candidatus Polarisedimenticolia bacterium]|nr:HAD hydrolase-like protein [Candidatus Polarisedimenticolia bacterium]
MPAPLDARGIRGIVFDLDGTLIDSYGAITESLNAALAALGFPTLAESRVRGLVGRGLETLMQRAMGLADARDPNITKGIGHFRER